MGWGKGFGRTLLSACPVEDQIARFLKATLPRYRTPPDIKAWPREAAKLRREALAQVMLKGWPKSAISGPVQAEWRGEIRPLGGRAGYVIRKVRYQVLPEYWIPALLYEPTGLKGPAPVVLNPNGHHRGGKAATYKQARCANLARRGCIALNFEFIGQSELEADIAHNLQAHLSLVGMAGVGLFYLAIKRGLDLLLEHRHADLTRVAMTGLSGGGWQTIILSALDPRITVSIPVAGYTSIRQRVQCMKDRGDLEQCPPDLGAVLDYTHLTALLAPRPTLHILNQNDDCCFRTPVTKPIIYDAIRPTFVKLNAGDRFEIHNNIDPGTHNYDADNRCALYRFLNRHFGLDAPATDLHEEGEIFPERDLEVGLPPTQQTMTEIAGRRALELAGKHRKPAGAATRDKLRARLGEVIRIPDAAWSAHRQKQKEPEDSRFRHYLLRTGPWTAPVSGRVVPEARQATLVLHDHGRQTYADVAPPPAPTDGSVFVLDLLGFGESRVIWNMLMLLETGGQRVLGIQVRQALAAAALVQRETGVKRIQIVAYEKAPSLAAMLAVALEPQRFSHCITHAPLMSLTLLSRLRFLYEDGPGLFCPGLLEVADIPQIEALMEGVIVEHRLRATAPWTPTPVGKRA